MKTLLGKRYLTIAVRLDEDGEREQRELYPRLMPPVERGDAHNTERGQAQDERGDVQNEGGGTSKLKAQRGRGTPYDGTAGKSTEEESKDSTHPREDGSDNGEQQDTPYERIQEDWNEAADKYGLPNIRKMTDKRKTKARKRWNEWRKEADEGDSPEDVFREIMVAVKESPFLLGRNGRDWRMDFDWLTQNEDNWVRVLEGTYEDASDGPPRDGRARDPADIPDSEEYSKTEWDKLEHKQRKRATDKQNPYMDIC